MTAFDEPTIAQVAADLIATVDAKLAQVFMAQPFNRVLIAEAFAAGFKSDPQDIGATVITCADLDRRERLEMAA